MESLLSSETSVRLERLVRLARRVRPERRRAAFKQPGKGIEVGSRRAYVSGDDLRYVDWPAYARLEQMLVKVTEDLPEGRLDLVLDGSASMRCGDPAPAERAALAAAGLAAVAVARELKVGVWIGGQGADRMTLVRPGELVGLLRFLARPRSAGEGPNLGALAAEISERVTRPGPVVFLSDGLAPEVVAAAARLARRRQVRVALIEASAELSPDAAARLGARRWAEKQLKA
ncbi:MAG: DUF58 domain-containing protein [Planctomycetes bacterium]|nr:DUF58 domain-containing protein [Planctomycetota bacterium]